MRRTDFLRFGFLASTKCAITTRRGPSGAIVKIFLWKSNSSVWVFVKRLSMLLSLFAWLNWWTSAVIAQDQGQGSLVISVNKETDHQSEVEVKILTQDTKALVATAYLGVPVHLPAGTYQIEFAILGGQETRKNVLVKTARTSTVIVSNLAALRVNVLDTSGNDLGIGVEVYDSAIGQQLGAFLSGETILSRPGVVDVKVAVPPQSQWIRKVELQANALAYFNFHQQTQGELVVRPTLNGQDASAFTQVIISRAGENKEIDRSEPGQVHRFGLASGTYDILVMNPTGSGKPFVQDRVELKGEGLTEKDVPLDKEHRPSEPKKAQTL